MTMRGSKFALPTLAKNLSARLLVLTVAFVMMAEVLIYVPSLSRFRLNYLTERLADAHLAILALEATPDQMVSEQLANELLQHAEAISIALTKPDAVKLILMIETPGRVSATYHLDRITQLGHVRDALMALIAEPGRVLRVVGTSPKDNTVEVDLVLNEGPLQQAMISFSNRVGGLSLVIGLITAALVYLSLHFLIVRPMRRITESMTSFREDPENASNIMDVSGRSDEVGTAQRELRAMQERLRAALHQKTRLAALGTAVTKINHDLRNILATARLVSDRLAGSADPEVNRITPTLLAAIDRAVSLCGQTLNFTREGPPPLELTNFELGALIDDVGKTLPDLAAGQAAWRNHLVDGLILKADRDQCFRVFSNLGHNAFQAGAQEVEISARRSDGVIIIDVSDDGPGLPPRAREKLFTPFAGSARPGGSGLGLPIARDLIRAHGGDIVLASSTSEGSRFRVTLPVDPEINGR